MAKLVKDAEDSDLFGAKPKGPESPDPDGEPKQKGPTGAVPSGKRPTWAPKLERELTELFTEYGTMLGLALPLTGYVFAERADRRAHAWVLLAETNPAVKKSLEKMLKGSAYGMIATDIAAVSIAAAVEFGRLRPDSGPAQVFGVTEAAMAVGYRKAQEAEVAEPEGAEAETIGGASAGGLLAELGAASAA